MKIAVIGGVGNVTIMRPIQSENTSRIVLSHAVAVDRIKL